jgi:FAD:protein FMN transferase
MLETTRRQFLKLTPIPSTAEAFWLHVSRTAMACKFEVTLPGTSEAGVSLANEALNEVDLIEQQLSVFRDKSEVSLLNRDAANKPIVVHPLLYELLNLCKDLHRDTEGAFDITSGPLTRCWGFLKRQGHVPDQYEIDRAMCVVGSEKLLLDSSSRAVRFANQGVEINLGSIGKGYALDRIASFFATHDEPSLLNAAGSSFRGMRSGVNNEGWVIGLRNPRDKTKRLGVVQLRDCALSTSGCEEQFFETGGKRYGHIIDPRTGWPGENVTSVTVVANSAAISDALATAFFVGGRALAERYCASHPEVLVIMLEKDATTPVLIGGHSRCVVDVPGIGH